MDDEGQRDDEIQQEPAPFSESRSSDRLMRERPCVPRSVMRFDPHRSSLRHKEMLMRKKLDLIPRPRGQ